jgi:adenylate cyclase
LKFAARIIVTSYTQESTPPTAFDEKRNNHEPHRIACGNARFQMTGDSNERKPLAILNGDVAGYSRLMADDEDATVRMLAAHRDAIGVTVLANHGRLVDFSGDNFLAEFGSAIHAVSCAVEIQRAIHTQYANIPAERRMNFRLGAHVGAVRIDGERIYGDAVNIAARLEALSEAGGICVSRQILDQIGSQIEIDCDDLGEKTLKNIPYPVHAYVIPAKALGDDRSSPQPDHDSATRNTRFSLGIPSIAVLPFSNLSTDAEQEYLADGMTADIITGLSCDKRFSVIAYNSVIQFKGKIPDIKELGGILGVRYVVEGAVRRIGARLRVTAALIEVETRRELWGERFDRALTDIFDIFDELIEAIVTALGSHLKLAEQTRFRRKPPGQLGAWELATRAFANRGVTTLKECLSLARRAVEIDPEYAYAWAVFGILTAFKFPMGASDDHQADIEESLRQTDRALMLDPGDPFSLVAKAVALQYGGRPAESMEYLHHSLRLNPSDVHTHLYYGRGLTYSGKPALAIAHLERFNRLNPADPGAHMAGMYHAIALAFLQRWEAAEDVSRASLAASGGRNPWSTVFLMIALGGQGKFEPAMVVLSGLKELAPKWDRKFVENFLTECQDDKQLLPPIFAILGRVWPKTDA